MAKAQIPVGYAKAAQHGTLQGCDWVNVFYYLIGDTTGHTPGDVVAAVAKATALFYSDAMVLAAMPNVWTTDYCTVTYRDAADSIVRLRVADAQTGGSGSSTQDAQVAYLINWSSTDPRRGGKPRQYVAGVADTYMQDSAALTAARQTAINTGIVTWLTEILTPGTGRAVGMQLEELSFRNGNAWRTDPVSYPIIGGTVNPIVATQRRRVDRRRPH